MIKRNILFAFCFLFVGQAISAEKIGVYEYVVKGCDYESAIKGLVEE